MSYLKKFKFLLPIAVIIILVTAVYMYIYANNPLMELFSVFKTVGGSTMANRPAPEIVGIEHWLNTPDGQGLKIKDLRGKVVLLDFWTYSCINCQRSLPYVTAWDRKYHDDGLAVIGIHTPEFRFERKLENVQKAVEQYNIEYPVALDNDYQTWQAYLNHYWPAKYLINKQGEIVYMRFGEGAYDITEQKIQELLAQPYPIDDANSSWYNRETINFIIFKGPEVPLAGYA